MNPEKAYSELVRLSREESVLASCIDVLDWDQDIYMPPAGVEHRAEQMALLAGLLHDRATNPRYDDLLSAVEGSSLVEDADSPEAVNVRELRRDYDRERKLPRRLVEEMARVTTRASKIWAQARKKNDFKSFAPWLDKVFALSREEADAVGHNGTLYDALLDEYEPGMTTEKLSSLFTQLGEGLVPLVDSLRGQAPSRNVLEGNFDIDRQRVFTDSIVSAIGFDLDAGRLDLAQHPFCTQLGPGDVRIGTRYYQDNVSRGIFACLHEAGMGCMTRVSTRRTTERRWVSRCRSVFTSLSRDCGRTLWGEARDSGGTFIRSFRARFTWAYMMFRWKHFAVRSIGSSLISFVSRRTRLHTTFTS